MIMEESKIRARVFDVIRRIIDIPPLSGQPIRNARKDWLRPPPIHEFKGIDPFMLYQREGDWMFRPEDCSPAVVWPIDVCVIKQGTENDWSKLMVFRYRTVRPKDVRGYANRISPFMLRRDVGVEDRGTFITASGLLSYIGGKWPDAVTANGYDKYQDVGGFAIGLALRHRYEWAVNIGFPNSPSVRFSTDPTGLKELFRLRGVADGRDRRDALMTWVSDHWRQDRTDRDIETYVRKHLRGTTRFEWRGMECEIKPSAYDIEQRDRYVAERAAMRKTGTDKRPAA